MATRPYKPDLAALMGGRKLEYLESAVDDYNRRFARVGIATNRFGPVIPYCVSIKNTTGSLLDRGRCVGIGDPIVLPSADENEWWQRRIYTGETLAAEHASKFGILQFATANNEFSGNTVVVCGACPALIQVSDAAHEFAEIDVGETRLKSAVSGPVKIIWKESGTGLKKAEVIVGVGGLSPSQTTKIGKTDASVSPGGTVTVSIHRRISGTLTDTGENVTDVHYDWIDAAAIASGKEVWIEYFEDEGLWRISDAECP